MELQTYVELSPELLEDVTNQIAGIVARDRNAIVVIVSTAQSESEVGVTKMQVLKDAIGKILDMYFGNSENNYSFENYSPEDLLTLYKIVGPAISEAFGAPRRESTELAAESLLNAILLEYSPELEN